MSASERSPTAKTSSPFASWKVDHVGIRVPDFDEAVAWYTGSYDAESDTLYWQTGNPGPDYNGSARDGLRIEIFENWLEKL